MSAPRRIVHQQLEDVLRNATEQARLAVLTHGGPQGWRTFKCAFLPMEQNDALLQVRTIGSAGRPSGAELQAGDAVGTSFRMGHKTCLFSSVAESIQRRNGGCVISLTRPDELHQLQRRSYKRATPPSTSVIAVRLWQTDGIEQTPAETRIVRHAQLEDLSVGGLRIKVPDPTAYEPGRTFRCVFTPKPGKPTLILDIAVRHKETAHGGTATLNPLAGGRASVGFEIVGLKVSPEGHKMLERLAHTVDQFQRAESRRRTSRKST